MNEWKQISHLVTILRTQSIKCFKNCGQFIKYHTKMKKGRKDIKMFFKRTGKARGRVRDRQGIRGTGKRQWETDSGKQREEGAGEE